MHIGKLVFSQVIDSLLMHAFRRGVARYGGNRYKKTFPCLDQYLRMAFAQLAPHESLRDIEVCLRVQKDKLYHRGIRGNVSRSAVADANERRDWHIYADLAQALIRTTCPLYADEDLGRDLDNAVYVLDASTIDLRLSVFPWALFFAQPNLLSSSRPCSIFKATSQPLSTSPTASYTTSMPLIC